MPALQRKLHLTNKDGLKATVVFGALKSPGGPRLGLAGKETRFKRFLATTLEGLHESLIARHGADYAQALVDGDPEVDMESVGRRVATTNVVFLSASGDVLHAAPQWVEVITDASGEERERRAPEDREANVNDEMPVRWTKRSFTKAEAVRRFVFSRTIQLGHVDDLTYEYLYGIAKELHESGKVVWLGGGPKGDQPLVFQTNGTPYHSFLEGRVDGKRYQLLLHLSNLELRRPKGDGA